MENIRIDYNLFIIFITNNFLVILFKYYLTSNLQITNHYN